jgi:methylene-tetrahydromethanopterin dehydrogenase
VIAASTGADVTLVDHISIDTALEVADEYNSLCESSMRGTYASSDADKARLVSNADVVFCTAKAGIQVLNASVLADATQLKVVGDVNAVPPLGVEGIKRHDFGRELEFATNSPGAVGIGALAVGDVKYNLQHVLLDLLLESEEPIFIDFRHAFSMARGLV